MLTGKQIRVRFFRDKIIPIYLDTNEPSWLEAAQQLLELFRGQEGRTRGELEEDLTEAIGNDPSQLIHRGLAKLLEDRCEFEVVSGKPPEEVREVVFTLAARQRRGEIPEGSRSDQGDGLILPPAFDRTAIVAQSAESLGMPTEAVEQSLFADLKSEQRLVRFKDVSPERLLQRYNVALVQAVLLRSIQVRIEVRGETPARIRKLMRMVKFHRLVCDSERTGPKSLVLRLDGPLSLFSATQKYGLQLALFVPAILPCSEFDLEADVRWGPQRKEKRFALSANDGLISPSPDTGAYVPPEMTMFAELFRKKIGTWEISEETEVLPLGESFWVPDFRLKNRENDKEVFLEILGFWRRSSAEKHLERLRNHAQAPFLLAVSDQLRIEEENLEGLSASIIHFRQMPLPDEVARQADKLIEVVN
jgi:predicted nuclease of restriction endonuclease-like RecB superfamily